jgi:hypothetical protein
MERSVRDSRILPWVPMPSSPIPTSTATVFKECLVYLVLLLKKKNILSGSNAEAGTVETGTESAA